VLSEVVVWNNRNLCFLPSELCVATVWRPHHLHSLSFHHLVSFVFPLLTSLLLQLSRLLTLISHLLWLSTSAVLYTYALQYADAIFTSFIKCDRSCMHMYIYIYIYTYVRVQNSNASSVSDHCHQHYAQQLENFCSLWPSLPINHLISLSM